MEYPIKYYFDVLNKYAVFEGRARRAEYWYFVLFNILIDFAIFIASIIISDIMAFLYPLFVLIIIIPTLAVGVRRLHDTGNSGWMILVGLIPLIGPIWLIILMATDGNVGTNKYGSDPKSPAVPTPTI